MEHYLGLSSAGNIISGPLSYPPQEVGDDGILRTTIATEMLDESSIQFEPFKDFVKRRFLWYYDSYLLAVQKARGEVQDGQAFIVMPFEDVNGDPAVSAGGMAGTFNYTELERRLRHIRTTLDIEVQRWAIEGMAMSLKEDNVSSGLRRQYEQAVDHFQRDSAPTLDISLTDNNPFVWSITYFGRGKLLDGGVFQLQLLFSPRFPLEQPRARFETSLYHQRISCDGTPCYTPIHADNATSHIEAIIHALEEPSPTYDPRTLVNPEASKLLWGSDMDKKKYHSKLRRSAQKSVE